MRLVKQQPKYKCSYCNKIAGIKAMSRHEPICYYNPERICELCCNEGYMESGYLGPTLGYISDSEDCSACENAYKTGRGKHYLSDEQIERLQLYKEVKDINELPF